MRYDKIAQTQEFVTTTFVVDRDSSLPYVRDT